MFVRNINTRVVYLYYCFKIVTSCAVWSLVKGRRWGRRVVGWEGGREGGKEGEEEREGEREGGREGGRQPYYIANISEASLLIGTWCMFEQCLQLIHNSCVQSHYQGYKVQNQATPQSVFPTSLVSFTQSKY